MMTDVTRSGTFKDIVVEPASMEIDRKESVPVIVGPIIAQIKHQPGVSVTAPRARRCGSNSSPDIIPRFLCVPMHVVGMLIDQFIGMWIEIFAVHSFVVRPRNYVPEVANNGIDEKHFSVIVVIEAPGVCRSLRHDFKN